MAVGLAVPQTALGQGLFPETKLVGSDSNEFDWFGRSVDIDGETLVVGAPRNDPNEVENAGAAYVFVRNGDTWTEEAKLVAPDGEATDGFGSDVAISGDTIVVAASGYDSSEVDSGGAYVFVRDGASWSHQATLVGDDAYFRTSFAGAVSISGDTIVVGDSGDDHPGTNAGAIYIWERSGTVWGPTDGVKLKGDDTVAYDAFGRSVSIDGDTLVVGASGSHRTLPLAGLAYVFVRSGGTWIQEDMLTGSDTAAGDNFGFSVSVSGDTLLAGANNNDPGGLSNAGAAYVFVRSGSTWLEEAKLTGSFPLEADNFGFSVSLSGDLAVIGAPFAAPDLPRPGKAYVFTRTGTAWAEEALVRPIDEPQITFEFGRAVAASWTAFVVGSYSLTVSPQTGAAYVYGLEPPTPDPVELIADLILQVLALNLHHGIENALDAKLDTSLNALTDANENNDGAVLGSLNAFINHVEAQRGKKIPEAAADELIQDALGIIALLTDGP